MPNDPKTTSLSEISTLVEDLLRAYSAAHNAWCTKHGKAGLAERCAMHVATRALNRAIAISNCATEETVERLNEFADAIEITTQSEAPAPVNRTGFLQ